MRHAARAHPGARQARGGARPARAPAPARRAAAHRPRAGRRLPLPAPDGSGALVVALDLARHEAVVEHSDGRAGACRSTPDRPVGEVTRERAGRGRASSAGRCEIDPTPQEVPWSVPLDEDDEHATYDPAQVGDLLRRGDPGRARPRRVPRALPRALDAGQRLVGLVRPRREPVLRRARPTRRPTTSSCATRWTPRRSRSAGGRATRATARRRSTPTPIPRPTASPATLVARRPRTGSAALGEYVLDWDDVRAAPDPHAAALEFARSAFRHACAVCDWDPALAASAEGDPPPVALTAAPLRSPRCAALAARSPPASTRTSKRSSACPPCSRPRGPDGHGSWVGGRIGLVHRRLKIIDLSERGAQPMVDEERGLAIVFNGCIYNYRELRERARRRRRSAFARSRTRR